MDIRSALKEQYHAGLAMLVDCIERCPDDLWNAPNPPVAVAPDPRNPEWNGCERQFWRIAFHAVYFTHLYLGQGEDAFQPPPANLAVRRRDFEGMWAKPWPLEPFELAPGTPACTPGEIVEYIRFVDSLIDPTIDGLDLDSPNSGIPWYKDFPKLSHELLTLRHLQGHIGQLSELLMLRGIDTDWVSRSQGLG